MKSLSERLRYVLFEKKLSQADAARRCGITQQAISYIIKNSVDSSKLSQQIAEGLSINHDWLIYGTGRMNNARGLKVPFIDNYFLLKAFISGTNTEIKFKYISTEYDYGEKAFAFQINNFEKVICCPVGNTEKNLNRNEYITISENNISPNSEKSENTYIICERRLYNVID
jgi:transcriptional regulator with XRE-family HTH domain